MPIKDNTPRVSAHLERVNWKSSDRSFWNLWKFSWDENAAKRWMDNRELTKRGIVREGGIKDGCILGVYMIFIFMFYR